MIYVIRNKIAESNLTMYYIDEFFIKTPIWFSLRILFGLEGGL